MGRSREVIEGWGDQARNSEKLSKGPGKDLVGRERVERGWVGKVRGRARVAGVGRGQMGLKISPEPQTGGL